MNTVTYALGGLVPVSESTGVRFVRLEMAESEYSPLALVWYLLPNDNAEHGARLDLQKRVFLDGFGPSGPGTFGAEAQLIVTFLNSAGGHRVARETGRPRGMARPV